VRFLHDGFPFGQFSGLAKDRAGDPGPKGSASAANRPGAFASPLAGCRADTRTETPGYARRASAFRGGPPFLVWCDVPAGIGRIRVASISQGRLRSMGSRALLGRVKARVRPASIAPVRRFDRRPGAGEPRSLKPRPAGN